MVKFILGEKGTGKTKWLVERANEDYKTGNGNIAFIDVDDDHIFTLNYNIRLINAMEFNVETIESFYGFLCGILSMDHDLEKIYIDSIYKVMDLSIDNMEKLVEKLVDIGEKNKVEFFINAEYTMDEIPEGLREYSTELK